MLQGFIWIFFTDFLCTSKLINYLADTLKQCIQRNDQLNSSCHRFCANDAVDLAVVNCSVGDILSSSL